MQLRKLLAAGAVAAGAVAVLAAPATAGQAGTVASPYAAQVRAAGLGAGQVAVLQSQVTSYLTQVGGRQVSANTIDLDGTGVLILAVPGEKYARDLGAPAGVSPLATCYPGDFCAWKGSNYTGSFLSKYVCSKFSLPADWRTPLTGSWKNNQTTGTKAVFYGKSGQVNYTTPGAPYVRTSWPWGAAPADYSILPCPVA